MGKLLLNKMGESIITPLKEHMILGRSPKSDIVLGWPSIPNLWLEIRYINNQWLWNVLNGDSDTIGTGTYTHNNWRHFSKQIRFNNVVKLELLDSSPPETLVELNGRFHSISAFPNIRPITQNRFALDTQILQNGTAFLYDNNICTIWIPGSTNPTEETSTNMETDGILKIDLDGLIATFEYDSHHYSVTGEAARTLATYAMALKEGTPWLTSEEAFSDWINLGGLPDSPPERIHWERNKILGKLNKEHAFPLISLFQRRRRGVIWEHRLEFSGDIEFINTPSINKQD